jgi:hypothetical protein
MARFMVVRLLLSVFVVSVCPPLIDSIMKLALSITILEATQPLYLLTQTEILYVAPSDA